MSLCSPLSELMSQGIRIELSRDMIKVSPKSMITDEVRRYVRQNRDAIVSELKVHKSYTLDELLIDTTDPNAALAIKYVVQGIGEFWICSDEAMRKELQVDGLPCILPKDLIYVTQGTSYAERLRRLKELIAVCSAMVQAISDEFPSLRIMKVKA
jgi:hypothetical protein